MRLPGRPTREGNSENPPSANDNQMDDMMSSAIDAFLGSSRQTYDEFIQNFTQLTAADVASTSSANSEMDIPGCSTNDSAAPNQLPDLDDNASPGGGDRVGIYRSLVRSQTGTSSAATTFTTTDVPSEFPGRDEPPPNPPVIASGDDELEEESLDGATATFSGGFTGNSAVRNLQVDNFVDDEGENSDEEKGDLNSEKNSNRFATNCDSDNNNDIPAYQASFSQAPAQAPAKCSKFEKNQANQMQQTIDKAQKDSINISQRHINRCCAAVENAEERLATSLLSQTEPLSDFNNDWIAQHKPSHHIPIRVQLRPAEEDLLDIIGDTVDSDHEFADQSTEHLVDGSCEGASANTDLQFLSRVYDLIASADNEVNSHKCSGDIDESRARETTAKSCDPLDQQGFEDSLEQDSMQLQGTTDASGSSIAIASDLKQDIDSLTPHEHPVATRNELVTDSDIDRMFPTMSNPSDTEVDEESSPVITHSLKDTINAPEDTEESLTYNSEMDSYNMGEIEDRNTNQNSVTNFRELSYSAKPRHEDGEDIPQTLSEPELLASHEATCEHDEVQAFSLDEDFDYDNVTLTPKYNAEEMEYLRSFLPSSK